MRRRLSLLVLSVAAMPTAWANTPCDALPKPRPLAAQDTMLAPISDVLTAPSQPLGAPAGVLAPAYDATQGVDQVVYRLKLESCQQTIASALPAAAPVADAGSPAAYVPRTEFDNAPWRFDMNQGGKRMTAEEFDAWMKSRGVRVAKGAPPPAAVAAPPVLEPGEGEGEE